MPAAPLKILADDDAATGLDVSRKQARRLKKAIGMQGSRAKPQSAASRKACPERSRRGATGA